MPIDVTLSADNTGATNVTPNVQAAIAQIKAAGGGRLIVPLGSYRLNSSGVVNNVRTAVNIDFGNVEIVSQNPVQRPLFFTDEIYFTPPPNSVPQHTTLFQFQIPGATPFDTVKLTRLILRGPTLTSPSQFPVTTGLHGALVFFYGKAWNNRMTKITVSNCVFLDPVRYAIGLGYCEDVSINNCQIEHYRSYGYETVFPPSGSTAVTAGIFSGAEAIENVSIYGCSFSGRFRPLPTNPPYNPALQYPVHFAADGFVFIQKGGNISITNNTIRRYYLEGVQTNAGPSYVTDNTFETPFSTGVAYMAYADTDNTTPGPTPYILQRLYHFKRNTVNGGSVGVKFAGNNYPSSGLAPQLTCEVTDNSSIQLNSVTFQPFTLGIFASSAASLLVKNNTFSNCGMMLKTGIDTAVEAAYPNVDFNCSNMTIENNVVNAFNGSQDCIFFQFPLRKDEMATIGKNTLARGNVNYAHIKLTGTNMVKVSGQIEAGKSYKVFAPNGGVVRYNTFNYSHGQTFTGVSGETAFTILSGTPQVRFATSAPWNYLARIGTSATNKNTYVTQGSSSTDSDNRFIYYEPSDNLVKEANAMPPNPPKDGVSVQEY